MTKERLKLIGGLAGILVIASIAFLVSYAAHNGGITFHWPFVQSVCDTISADTLDVGTVFDTIIVNDTTILRDSM